MIAPGLGVLLEFLNLIQKIPNKSALCGIHSLGRIPNNGDFIRGFELVQDGAAGLRGEGKSSLG